MSSAVKPYLLQQCAHYIPQYGLVAPKNINIGPSCWNFTNMLQVLLFPVLGAILNFRM